MKLWIINLIIRLKLFWMNKRKWLIVLGAILGIIIVWAIVAACTTSRFFYIDWDGNSGVADKCWVDNGRLLCEKMYNGVVNVRQYWKGR